MAKLTLLQIVQKVLNDMDGDDVATYNETTESTQVASLAEDVYFALLAEDRLPDVKATFPLTVTSSSTPAAMQIPTDVTNVEWIMFDARTAEGASDTKLWQVVEYLTPAEFMAKVMGRSDTDTTVEEMSDATITGGVPINIYNDRAPKYYTSFDDEYLIFDAYDSDIDTELPAAKTIAFGSKEPTFTQSDAFVPDLDADLFPFYLAEVKSHAFAKFKEEVNGKDEQQARRLRVRKNRDAHRSHDEVRQSNFGRPGKGR